MAALTLTLFGGLQAWLASGTAVRVPTKKAEALLAYLAIHPGRAYQRDKLAALLWGDTADEHARGSLRQTLSLLGKALAPVSPPCLIIEGRTVALAARAVDVDVVRFEAAVARGRPESLEQAVVLYRDGLLEGLTLDEAPFEEWLLGERERLRELAMDSLSKLLAHHTSAAGAADRAISTAARLLALDPCQEPVHRALMRLYGRQGRHAAALRQYQVCVAALQRELGAEPEAETKALYRDMVQKRTPEAAPAARGRVAAARPPAPALPSRDTRMIGRDAELDRLTQALDEAWSGEGRIAIVAGEAGIGKTRLVEELSVVAVQRQGRVAVGHCYETEQILPFAPWAAALRAGGLLADDRLQKALPAPARAALSRVLPELAAAPADFAHDPDNPLQLFDGLARLVSACAARAPLLVVLEDLHWADDMSLRFLAFLGRRAGAANLLVVGTTREEEVAGAPSLARTLDELRRHATFTPLSLGALSSADTTALVQALAKAGSEAGAVSALAAHVWRTSEGNPFVAVETMRAIQEGVVSAGPGTVAVPGTVRDLIVRRLERLSERGRQLAAVAAIANGPVDFPLLVHASGLPQAEAADGLEELVRHRMLHGVGDDFDFTHDRVRHVAVELLLAPRREAVHAAIGEALETLHADAPGTVLDRLAYHYARTRNGHKAVEYLTRFAESAARGGGHADAIAALDQALGRVGDVPAAGREAARLDLTLRKARSLFFLGRFTDVFAVLAGEQEAVDKAGDPRLAAAYYFRLGSTCTYAGDHARAHASATRALAEAARIDDVATMGKAHFLLSLASFWSRPAEGVEHGREAVRLLGLGQDRGWLGQAYWIFGLNCSYRGRFAEALAAQAQAQRIGEALGDRRLESYAAWTTGFVQTLAGHFDVAVAACERSIDLAVDPLTTMTALGMLALAHGEKGEPKPALAALERAIPQARRFAIPHLEGLFLTFEAHAHLLQGDVERARPLAGQGAAITRDSGYVYGHAWSQRVLARIAHAAGDVRAAHAWLQEAIATFASMGAPYEVGRTTLELAEALAFTGDVTAAAGHARQAAAVLGHLGFDHLAGRAAALAEASR